MLDRGSATRTFVASTAGASFSRLATLTATTIMETTAVAAAAISTAAP